MVPKGYFCKICCIANKLQNPSPDQLWFCAAEEESPPLAPSASHPSLDGQHGPIGVAEFMLIALGIWP